MAISAGADLYPHVHEGYYRYEVYLRNYRYGTGAVLKSVLMITLLTLSVYGIVTRRSLTPAIRAGLGFVVAFAALFLDPSAGWDHVHPAARISMDYELVVAVVLFSATVMLGFRSTAPSERRSVDPSLRSG